MHLFHFVFGRGFPVEDLYDRMFLEDVFGRLLLSWDGHDLDSRSISQWRRVGWSVLVSMV
jgi:hypothetical protein